MVFVTRSNLCVVVEHWQGLEAYIASTITSEHMDKIMATFFADYQWSKGEPKGISPINDPTGIEHFRLLEVDNGVRVEQFDEAGKFVRLVYCPQDRKIAGTTYETSTDHLHKVRPI